LQKQVTPSDPDKRLNALKSLASQLDKKHSAPNKKAIDNFIGESHDNKIIIESFKEFVNKKKI